MAPADADSARERRAPDAPGQHRTREEDESPRGTASLCRRCCRRRTPAVAWYLGLLFTFLVLQHVGGLFILLILTVGFLQLSSFLKQTLRQSEDAWRTGASSWCGGGRSRALGVMGICAGYVFMLFVMFEEGVWMAPLLRGDYFPMVHFAGPPTEFPRADAITASMLEQPLSAAEWSLIEIGYAGPFSLTSLFNDSRDGLMTGRFWSIVWRIVLVDAVVKFGLAFLKALVIALPIIRCCGSSRQAPLSTYQEPASVTATPLDGAEEESSSMMSPQVAPATTSSAAAAASPEPAAPPTGPEDVEQLIARRRMVLTLLEQASIFYRALIVFPLWALYWPVVDLSFSLQDSQADPTPPTAVTVAGMVYMLAKIWFLLERVALLRMGCDTRATTSAWSRPVPESERHDLAESAEACSICQEPVASRDPVALVPCGHVYCRQCIAQWVTNHQPNCPICRTPVSAPSSAPAVKLGGDGGLTIFPILM
jgi:hypothetical protein